MHRMFVELQTQEQGTRVDDAPPLHFTRRDLGGGLEGAVDQCLLQAVRALVARNHLAVLHFGLTQDQEAFGAPLHAGQFIQLAAHDEGPEQTAENLCVTDGVLMRVVPERARGMVCGKVVGVIEGLAGLNGHENVVARLFRRDVPSVCVQVGGLVDVVDQRHLDAVTRSHVQRRPGVAALVGDRRDLPAAHGHIAASDLQLCFQRTVLARPDTRLEPGDPAGVVFARGACGED